MQKEDICSRCLTEMPDIFSELDENNLCYYCDYTDEERLISDISGVFEQESYLHSDIVVEEKEENINNIAVIQEACEIKEIEYMQYGNKLSTIIEYVCYCGDETCENDCGVLQCGCIDCCRCIYY
jgi:hypothetical protein